MVRFELFNNGSRRCMFFGRDKDRQGNVIDTNEYLIMHNGKGMLLDPGGLEIFPFVVSVISRELDIKDIESIFATHQDPDIISSLSLWVGLNENIVIYTPWLWQNFISHFGGLKDITPLPDEGGEIPLGGSRDIVAVPAHYMHSSGNFSIYDPVSKILFSGDIGAALLPEDYDDVFVKDVGSHVQYMEGFHRRWMPSNRAKQTWIERVSALDVNLICPQHGAVFKQEQVGPFLSWLDGLDVGSAV